MGDFNAKLDIEIGGITQKMSPNGELLKKNDRRYQHESQNHRTRGKNGLE